MPPPATLPTPFSVPDRATPLSLAFHPPLAWSAMLGYLEARAIPGVEAVTHEESVRYWRSMVVDGHQGYLSVGPDRADPQAGMLAVALSPSLAPASVTVTKRLRQMLDLDLEPASVTAVLRQDPRLAPLVRRLPGLRVPGSVNRFELALRAVLGQQVTVRGASTLAGRLVQLAARRLPGVRRSSTNGAIPLTHLPVDAARLAEARPASLMALGLPSARVRCILALARATASGELPELSDQSDRADPAEFEKKITQLPGIGPWTAQYILMRGLGWSDAFPESDLGLRKAMGGMSPARLRAAAERWRPWRAYAAQHLWASLNTV